MGIYIGLGANLDGPDGPPPVTLELALERFTAHDMRIVAKSRWYLSEAVPDPSDPPFTNGVVEIDTRLGPEAVMGELHAIERSFGRVRGRRWAPRVLDLDLLDFEGLVRQAGPSESLQLPHPRMHERAFVLLPLREIAPEWRHVTLSRSINDLIVDLPENARASAV